MYVVGWCQDWQLQEPDKRSSRPAENKGWLGEWTIKVYDDDDIASSKGAEEIQNENNKQQQYELEMTKKMIQYAEQTKMKRNEMNTIWIYWIEMIEDYYENEIQTYKNNMKILTHGIIHVKGCADLPRS